MFSRVILLFLKLKTVFRKIDSISLIKLSFINMYIHKPNILVATSLQLRIYREEVIQKFSATDYTFLRAFQRLYTYYLT